MWKRKRNIRTHDELMCAGKRKQTREKKHNRKKERKNRADKNYNKTHKEKD